MPHRYTYACNRNRKNFFRHGLLYNWTPCPVLDPGLLGHDLVRIRLQSPTMLTKAVPVGRQRLGRSELHVPQLCFGTMLFGESISGTEAYKLLDECMENGIDFFDTAEMYDSI